MYQFQIRAYTEMGDIIGLVGSTTELGNWDIRKCIYLTTSGDNHPFKIRYPVWITEKIGIKSEGISYKYVIFKQNGSVEWETGENRWVPKDSNLEIMVDDGSFGFIQSYPFGYSLHSSSQNQFSLNQKGLKILVLGSSVAEGHKSWLMQGWVSLLARSLNQNGHEVINVSEAGADISRTIARFSEVVTPKNPDIVIIALSLGNEGFPTCPVNQRRTVQKRFERGLQELLKMTRQIGAMPILGGVYPHNNYESEHQRRLWDTHNRMLNWGVPVLNWLADLDDGLGHWKSGISFDPAHPNTIGHQRMYEAIALDIFDITKAQLKEVQTAWRQQTDIYLDRNGFRVFTDETKLRIINPSKHDYVIAPYWQELQTAIQTQGKLLPGIYLSQNLEVFSSPYLYVSEDGKIENEKVPIPAYVDLTFISTFNYFSSHQAQVIFQEGDLEIICVNNYQLWIVNESEHEYSIQPMWAEVRKALAVLPTGVYIDAFNPDTPFRTMMIGKDGLESRVKVPPKSALLFGYKCPLADLSRVAILPLGDRCAVRMMLYKMEYDGPAFPFDLTRTTKISDVSDAIATGFEHMWNPDFLEYNSEEMRIYHRKWQGLSFAHEVEAEEDPINNMSPIYERMQTRYSARSKRFWYTLNHCDQVLFVRTGVCDRFGVMDLVEKLKTKCQDKPFQLLILSPQQSDQFLDLAHVLHYDLDFNPDRMYDNLDHWLYCTEIMRNILTSLDISSKNLFWCPPQVR